MRTNKWVLSGTIAVLCILLVEFPRGMIATPLRATLTTPMVFYHWSTYRTNLLDLWHRVSHLNPGDVATGIEPICKVVVPAWMKSFEFMVIGLAFIILFGLTKGIFDGLQQVQRPKFVLMIGILQWIFEAMPNFMFILLLELISFFLYRYGIHMVFVGQGGFWTTELTPGLLIAIGPGAYLARMMRLSVQEQFGQPYLTTARSKGLHPWMVLRRHVLPNAIAALVDEGPIIVGLLFTNLVMVEYLMAQPGITSVLFSGMGQQGFQSVYWPVNDKPTLFHYQVYDPQLTLAAIVACVVLFGFMLGVLRVVARICRYRGVRNPYSGIPQDTNSRRSRLVLIWTGAVFIAIPTLAGGFVDIFQKYNPNDQRHWDILHSTSDGLMMAPFPPSWHHLFGTDARGRDLFIESLHGILPTFGYVLGPLAVIMGLATAMALFAGLFESRIVQWIIQVWNGIFSFMPRALAMLLILNIPDVFWYDSTSSLGHLRWGMGHQMIYMTLLVVVETGSVASALWKRIQVEMCKEYIEAAWISGNSKWSAFLLHIWPPFRAALMELFTSEFAALLLLIATLGFFENPIYQEFLDLQGPPFPPQWSFVPASLDWAGLISENARDILDAPWVILAPVLFITMTVLAMNLIREGLQKQGVKKGRVGGALRISSHANVID